MQLDLGKKEWKHESSQDDLRKCKRSSKRYWEKLSTLINMHNIKETGFEKYQAYEVHAHMLLQW